MATDATLSQVEYTTADIASRLNVPEAQVRIAAKQLQIDAPYSQGHLDAFALHFQRLNTTQSNEVKPTAIAPMAEQSAETITASSSEELPPAFLQFCDALETDLTQKLSAEMQVRLPKIKAAVIDQILPQQ